MNTQNRRQFLKSLGAVAAGGLMISGAALVAAKQPKNNGWLTKEEFLAKLDRQNNRIVGEKIKIDHHGIIDLSEKDRLLMKDNYIVLRKPTLFSIGGGQGNVITGNEFKHSSDFTGFHIVNKA